MCFIRKYEKQIFETNKYIYRNGYLHDYLL